MTTLQRIEFLKSLRIGARHNFREPTLQMVLQIWGARENAIDELSQCGDFTVSGKLRTTWHARINGSWADNSLGFVGNNHSGTITYANTEIGKVAFVYPFLRKLEIHFELPQMHFKVRYSRFFEDHGPRDEDGYADIEGERCKAQLCVFPAEQYIFDTKILTTATKPLIGDDYMAFLKEDAKMAEILMVGSLLGHRFH